MSFKSFSSSPFQALTHTLEVAHVLVCHTKPVQLNKKCQFYGIIFCKTKKLLKRFKDIKLLFKENIQPLVFNVEEVDKKRKMQKHFISFYYFQFSLSCERQLKLNSCKRWYLPKKKLPAEQNRNFLWKSSKTLMLVNNTGSRQPTKTMATV